MLFSEDGHNAVARMSLWCGSRNLPLKYDIQVFHMHKKLNAGGVLIYLIKNGVS